MGRSSIANFISDIAGIIATDRNLSKSTNRPLCTYSAKNTLEAAMHSSPKGAVPPAPKPPLRESSRTPSRKQITMIGTWMRTKEKKNLSDQEMDFRGIGWPVIAR